VRVRVPGDKSLTQRALILATLAEGESRLSGLLFGGDAHSTAAALRGLGATIPPLPADGSEIRVPGLGLRGLVAPESNLELGNSGTGARLLMGVIAGSGITATLDGDASLRTRPMARVTHPLSAMGARFEHGGLDGCLPITVHGRHPLEPVDWPSPVASAQVKSAILLAAVTGKAFAMVTEPRQSRDHTERLLTAIGARVVSHAVEDGWRVELRDPPERLHPLDLAVPGDISSAAFLLGLAALGGGGESVTVEGVGLNPTRTAFLDVLARMGAPAHVTDSNETGPEPVADVTVARAPLIGTSIGAEEVPRLIDELPMIAVLGVRARGTTRITGAAELRAKESDRISALVSNLRTLGVEVEELSDGLVVEGTARPLRGSVRSWDDHRIAMAFDVLAALEDNEIEIDRPEVADVSFPGFRALIHRLAA
jgi:3-phosphoshikimate 1-carboxyvinyltransferase